MNIGNASKKTKTWQDRRKQKIGLNVHVRGTLDTAKSKIQSTEVYLEFSICRS